MATSRPKTSRRTTPPVDEQNPEFVLVEHENGIVAPVGRVFAETYKLNIVEGDAVDLRGRPVRPTTKHGRDVKPRRNLPTLPESSDAAQDAASDEAVTPTEGAADSTLTTTKE